MKNAKKKPVLLNITVKVNKGIKHSACRSFSLKVEFMIKKDEI